MSADDLAWRRLGLGEDGVGITDVDCTPRPRFREKPEQFAARMRKLWLEADGETRIIAQRNRVAALRNPEPGVYYTMCACHFKSLRSSDPEVAQREYDAHACVIAESGNDIHRQYRGPVDKRPASKLIPGLASEREAAGVTIPGETAQSAETGTSAERDTEKRMALLELK